MPVDFGTTTFCGSTCLLLVEYEWTVTKCNGTTTYIWWVVPVPVDFGTATFYVSTYLLSVEYEWTDKVPMALRHIHLVGGPSAC